MLNTQLFRYGFKERMFSILQSTGGDSFIIQQMFPEYLPCKRQTLSTGIHHEQNRPHTSSPSLTCILVGGLKI